MATLTVKPSNTLKIKTQRVKKAYLAKKEIKGTEKTGETESYTFKGSNNTSTKARKEKIATIIYKNIKGGLQKKEQQTTVAHIVEVLKKDSYTKGDCIDIPLILPKIEFTKLANANLGDDVYMVVETENMANKRIKLSLKQAEKNCLVEKDSSIVLQQDGKKTSVVETYVSRFAEQNKKNISNAEDFRNFAIDAVTLSPKDEKDQKKYREALNKTTDKKTKLFMVVDAEPVGASWKEVFYDEVFDLTPNQWYYGEENWFELKSKSVVEIGVYHTGHIDKVELKDAEKVKYVYYDKDGKKHNLKDVYDIIQVEEYKNGKALESVPTGFTKEETISKGRKKYTYTDKVVVKGTKGEEKGKIRKYIKTGKKTPLIQIGSKNYTGQKLPIQFKLMSDSTRPYIHPNAFACVLGAIANVGYKDITMIGFTSKDNHGFPSTTHVNGLHGDFRYLRNDKTGASLHINNDEGAKELDVTRQEKMIDAFHKFGWKRFYSVYYTLNKVKKILKLSDNMPPHHHHLHTRLFTPKYKK
ncbi:hypothetical protein SAMN05444344_2642 [Tenacibaculum mesophilum]|uniref:Peptidoglycan-binding protein n=1 Tax=Tenacibaculum mesophilum TaxID=104268 RepID=A0ABN5T894_9FLAO|nr:hypothetical protein [Tenacibaculum mesophilum]AZJ32560.1 peptidoglycan-binding protein [Tenacibaculum mesophilum]QFS27811.1 peptidoglycan-binding protein [Tenacibaculum mesophilum]SHG08245.1 hypothetical protein SAMN05444344_2642 [Tenacibaculum mesophilum]